MRPEFGTTSWSQVLTARDGSDTESSQALEALCERYWYPLYAYIRRQGNTADQARDLTQGFFVHLLEKDTLQRADPGAGRFRSFLLGSVRNFLSHDRERSSALKRGGPATTLSLDKELAERRYGREPAGQLTPEEIFERRWALTVVEQAMRQLRAEYSQDEDRRRFARLQPYLVGEEPHIPYRAVAEELGMTEGAVKAAVRRARQRFGDLLRQEIGQTLADPGDVDDELRHLLLVIRPFHGKSE